MNQVTSLGVVEWAPIELADGVDEATLLKASAAFQQDFVCHQQGFIRRDLLKAKDGLWIDLIYWQNETDAQLLMQNAENSLACLNFFKLMKQIDSNNPAAGILHCKHLQSYTK